MNENFPPNFLIPLKRSSFIREFDIEKVREAIRKRIEQDSSLNGKIFYIQGLEPVGRGKLSEVTKIGRIYL